MAAKPCPTIRRSRQVDARPRKTPAHTIAQPRRAKKKPPIIGVLTGDGFIYTGWARAHLRNKKGYVYLTWRDGARVHSFYIGKAPRKSPTTSSSSSSPAPAPGLDVDELRRKGKRKA